MIALGKATKAWATWSVCGTRGCSEVGALTGWQRHPPSERQLAGVSSAPWRSQQLWQRDLAEQHPELHPSSAAPQGAQPHAARGDHEPSTNANAAARAGTDISFERRANMGDRNQGYGGY
jgi:hypothetical protein